VHSYPASASGLVSHANYFITQAISDSTRAVYTSAVNSFSLFAKEHKFISSALPISESDACLYISWCVTRTSKKPISFASTRNYLFGISSYHSELGYNNWLNDKPLLHKCLKGIKRSMAGGKRPPRQPITTDLLAKIRTQLNPESDYASALYWAAATTAVYGLLRLGEVTTNILMISNLTLYDEANTVIPLTSGGLHRTSYYTIRLASSKTDPYRKGVVIHIGNQVAVSAMVHYLSVHPLMQCPHVSTPLFVQSKAGDPLSRSTVIDSTRLLLRSLNIDSSQYFGHSFRRGGATSLHRAGVPDSIIQTVGRWASDCYKLYVDISLITLLNASRLM
jgi:hypothetical protein